MPKGSLRTHDPAFKGDLKVGAKVTVVGTQKADDTKTILERLDSSRQHRNHKVCERNIVPAGCELATKCRGTAPVFPTRLEIMSQAQPGGHPVGLVGAAKPPQNLGKHRPCQRHPVFIEQRIRSWAAGTVVVILPTATPQGGGAPQATAVPPAAATKAPAPTAAGWKAAFCGGAFTCGSPGSFTWSSGSYTCSVSICLKHTICTSWPPVSPT